jgi:hypothetical protein
MRATGHHVVDSSAHRKPVKAFRFAPTPFGAHGLDRLADEPMSGSYVMAGRLDVRSREETTMPEISPAPNIPVVIGGQLRVYLAYITTADPSIDGPSTLTLYASTLSDLSGFAANPIVHTDMSGRSPARLVVFDLCELAWHRVRYREEHCLFTPADPMLVSLKTLQTWLWQRLQAPTAIEVHT